MDRCGEYGFREIKALLERKRRPLEDFDAAIATNASTLVSANVKQRVGAPGLRLQDWLNP